MPAKKKKDDNSLIPKDKGDNFGIDLEEMLKSGLHFGHRISLCHPKIKPYLLGVRNTVHIIDLEKISQKFKEALNFIQGFIAEGKTLMIIGTKIQVKELVKKIAEECDLPYVNERWLGGTFTNFEVIKKRINYFKDLERKKAEKEFEKYTKKERANIDKELKNLEIKFGGLKKLEKIPEAIFILDMKKDKVAVKEARMKGVKVIGIADTNIDPTLADFPIPANDDAISSVKYILEKVKEVILSAKRKRQSAKPQLKTES